MIGNEVGSVLFCQCKTIFVVSPGLLSIQEQLLSHGTLLAWKSAGKGGCFWYEPTKTKTCVG